MLALCGTLHSLVWSTLPVDDGMDEDDEWDDVLVQESSDGPDDEM